MAFLHRPGPAGTLFPVYVGVSMRVTRRQLTLGALGTVMIAPALGAVAPGAESATPFTVDDLRAALRVLCARLDPSTTVTVTRVETARDTLGDITVDLALHLVWSPGERRVPYRATAPDVHRALALLHDRIAADLIALHRPRSGPVLPSRQKMQIPMA